MNDAQVKEMASQLAWCIRQLSQQTNGVTPECAAMTEKYISAHNGPPSNHTTTVLLMLAHQEFYEPKD